MCILLQLWNVFNEHIMHNLAPHFKLFIWGKKKAWWAGRHNSQGGNPRRTLFYQQTCNNHQRPKPHPLILAYHHFQQSIHTNTESEKPLTSYFLTCRASSHPQETPVCLLDIVTTMCLVLCLSHLLNFLQIPPVSTQNPQQSIKFCQIMYCSSA